MDDEPANEALADGGAAAAVERLSIAGSLPHDEHDRQNVLDESLATKSWEELLELLTDDPSALDLHQGLTFDAVAKELETKAQQLADQGDELMAYVRKIASHVKKMPMVPNLALLRSMGDMVCGRFGNRRPPQP